MDLDIKILNSLEKEYYIYLTNNWEEEVKMDEIINKLRKSKRKVKKVFNMLKKEIDLEESLVDSRILEELTTLAKIDEEITEIIYLVLDKNS